MSYIYNSNNNKMKTLTKAQQKKIMKAQSLIAAALELLNSVDKKNDEFRYDGNRNSLFNRLEGAESIVTGMVNEINFQNSK